MREFAEGMWMTECIANGRDGRSRKAKPAPKENIPLNIMKEEEEQGKRHVPVKVNAALLFACLPSTSTERKKGCSQRHIEGCVHSQEVEGQCYAS
mmetsp:Transcript_1394/g.8604  ORF Transcript_1394/g.8604 Transcript_1394/m.8604 type:complete len:95 (-) Transcript_1394:2629-2913(-)